MKYYGYKRVSTDKQDIGRQTIALEEWEKEKNIKLDDVFTDYYTGKTFNREKYQELKAIIQKDDYLVVKEVDRLGRDWDGIKKEWEELKDKGVNIIIIDMPILSDNLPNERPYIEGLDLKFIKEQILSLMCYTAQKEREKISQRTKEGMAKVKLNGSKSGKPIGRPREYNSTKNNFIRTLEFMIDKNYGQRKACLYTGYPSASLGNDLKKCYDKYNTKDYKQILKCVKEDKTWFSL